MCNGDYLFRYKFTTDLIDSKVIIRKRRLHDIIDKHLNVTSKMLAEELKVSNFINFTDYIIDQNITLKEAGR